MRFLLLLPLVAILVASGQNPTPNNGSQVAVLSHSWSKTKLAAPQQTSSTNGPAAAMIPQNRNFERNRRANMPPGDRDPNMDSMDGRSAAMERSVEESRSNKKPIEGFEYNAKLQNQSAKTITAIIWEYQFKESLNPSNITGRQFLCGVAIKSGKGQDFRVVTPKGPSEVISAASLANGPKDKFQETVLINFIEYSDGSVWQRNDWDSEAARRAFDSKAVKERVSSLCFGL
jgi:hypothetical protein